LTELTLTPEESIILGVVLLSLKTLTKQDWADETAVKDETGKTWFRLSAETCSEKVLEVWNARVSVKGARKALQGLAEKQLLLRRQGVRHPYDKTYSYAKPDDLTERGKWLHRAALKSSKEVAEYNQRVVHQNYPVNRAGQGFG